MAKYYLLLGLAFLGVLLYVFLQDPCSNTLRTDFSTKYPGYEILDTSAGEKSTDSVQCHIRYRTPDSAQTFEDVWLYQDLGSGWSFSSILEEQKKISP